MNWKLNNCSYCCRTLSLFLVLTMILAYSAEAQGQRDQVEEILNAYHDQGLFNGSVLVAKKGEVIFKGGFGEADKSWNIPNSTDTKFRIASSTKQFTAALILKLVEEGELELKGKVTDYLADYPPEQGNKITIHHLLSHTSGIPSYTTPAFMANEVRDPFTPDSLVGLFSALELQFEPGSRWSYSNSGYILLGAIIEAVTGKPYQNVLQEYILNPLGLTQTGYDNYRDIVTHKATGYINTPGGFERAPYLDTSVPYSAGMLYSTVEDLFKWDRLLYSEKVFNKKETKALLFKHHAAIPKAMTEQFNLPPHYGYGWFTGQVPVDGDTVTMIEHGGNIFGFSTGFWRMPDERNTVILMDNTSSREVRNLGHALISILYNKEPQYPRKPIGKELFKMIDEEGISAAKERYKTLWDDHREGYNFEESQLNTLGYYYLQNDKVEYAIAVFKLNLLTYPKSANGYDSLGEAYMKAGMKDKAIESYRKSLELNPNNKNAQKLLKQFGVEDQ